MIEEGIYRNIDMNTLICSCCSMKLTEDEFDIWLVCPAYRDLRHQSYQDIIADGLQNKIF